VAVRDKETIDMNALRILAVVVAAVAGGAVGYQLGLTQGIASEGGSVVVHGGGFGFGWFLFLFIILLFVAAARPRWGGWGPGGPGRRGRWHDGFDEWHREAHREPQAPTPADRS
jgi:hypothetical protein